MKRFFNLTLLVGMLVLMGAMGTKPAEGSMINTPVPNPIKPLPQKGADMPGWPQPEKPIPFHEAGKPANADSYVTEVTRLDEEGLEETVQISGVDALAADNVDPLAGNYNLVNWDKLMFGAYQNQNSFGFESLGYYSPTLDIITGTAVSLGNYQANDITAGDLNGDDQAEQIAAWIGSNQLYLSIGEMPGSQRATSAPAAVARSGTAPGGSALDFDGIDDYIQVPHQPSLDLTNFTLEAWIKADTWTAQHWQGTIVGKDDWDVSSTRGYVMRVGDNGRLSLNVACGSSWVEALSEPLMTVNTWYHVAGTFDGTNLTALINGVPVGVAICSDPIPIPSSPKDLNIGRDPNDNTRLFDGLIDEVGIWDRARTADQIQADLIRSAPDPTGLVAYWRFDDGPVSTAVVDETGNHDGTLVGPPDWVMENAPVAELHLVVRGYDETLWHCLYDVESGDCLTWSNAAGGTLASGPAIVSSGTDQFELFALGTDNQVYQRSWNGGWTGNWLLHPDPSVSSSLQRAVPLPEWPSPAAVARGSQIDLFRVAPDNTLRWQHSADGSTWGAWQSLDGMLGSGPGAISLNPNHMQVFARGVDETLWTRTYTGGAWGAWQRVPLNGMDPGVTLASAPTAVSPSPGEILVYARGSDGQLWRILYAGGTWGSWSAGADPMPLASGVGAAFLGGNSHVFTLSDDGQLQHSSDDGDNWTTLRRLEPFVTYNTGEQTAAPAPPTDIDNFDVDVETGNFLGDGRDQIVAAFRDNGIPNDFHIKVYDTQPGFQPVSKSETVVISGGAARIATGDFDGDGLDEIAVVWIVEICYPNCIYYKYQVEVYDAYDSQGSWTNNLRLVDVDGPHDIPISIGSGFMGTLNITSGDFDGDNDDEIAVTADWCCSAIMRPLPEKNTYYYHYNFDIFDLSNAHLNRKYSTTEKSSLDDNWPPWNEWGMTGFALAAGDLDGNGTDEIVRTWPDGPDAFHNHGWKNLYRQLQIIDASELITPTVTTSVPLGHYSAESWAERLAVGDLDRDLVEEIAFFKVVGDKNQFPGEGSLQVHVYEYNQGALELKDSRFPDRINFANLRATKLVAADFTGESLRVGTPTYRLQNRVDSLVAVINVPPKHRDYVKVDDGGGNFHYELFEVGMGSYAQHAKSSGSTSETGIQSQRDWAIGAGLDAKVTAGGAFVDTSLSYSYGDNFTKSEGTIHTTNFSQSAYAYTNDKIVYFGTPYQVWEYPIFVQGTREPVDYLTVVFPVPDNAGNTRAADTTAGDYPEDPWYRAGHQAYNAWSYDPVGSVGFPNYDPAQEIIKTSCQGCDEDYYFSMFGSTTFKTSKTKTHDFSAEVGAGYEGSTNFFGIKFGAEVRAYVNGSYSKADIETEKQTTSDNTDISWRISGQPQSKYFTIQSIGYWAKEGYLVLDYQTNMPSAGDWPLYYSSPDPAFILPWAGFPYGPNPVPPTVGLELFSPEIQLVPGSASVGDTVTISATVRNFSNALVSDVKVRFCQGVPICASGDSAFIGEASTGPLNRVNGPVTVSTQWDADGVGEQRIYAVIDPDNQIDPEVHDEDDLINNNVAYGLIRIGAAAVVDQGLATELPYQSFSYDQGSAWMVMAYVPPGNLSEIVHFELQDAGLNVPNAVGKPFELVAYEGDAFRENPNYDFDLKPGISDPPAVIGLAQSGTNMSNLDLYQAMDMQGQNWMLANCPGYQIHRFPGDDLILVPVCKAGIFVFSDKAPGPTPAPVAQFGAAPTSGPAPLGVTFTDQSSNYPTSWLWDFGDGITSTSQHPFHLYTVPGIYTVTLSVSSIGGSDTMVKPNHVTATGLLAAFSATPLQGALPLTVTFTDQSAGFPGQITSWDWDFGDGGTSIEQHPQHTYNVEGDYTVTLTVDDGNGTDVETKVAYISVYKETKTYLPLILR